MLIISSAIVYIQASSANAELIQRFNICSGGLATVCSSLLSYCKFAQKSVHYGTIKGNLQRLRCWIESKLVLPEHKRYSPYDIFIIGKRAYDAILLASVEQLDTSS